MEKGDIVFDIETKHSFDEVGGKNNFHKLGVSVLGAFIYGPDKFMTFEEHELPEFEKLLRNAGKIIGFNIHHFDLPVLQPYVSVNLRKEPATLDLMNDVEKGAGFRISLDNLCTTTLGAKKSADGLQAIRWFKEGKLDLIKEYCLKDVELTKSLYEYGAENGNVSFYSKYKNTNVDIPVSWGKLKKSYVQGSIF
jgi:DEAD/DEAH box helicase domain-containing protein